MDAFWFAIFVTLLAGLATGIGGLIAFTARHTNPRLLAWSLGLSAGVMIFVSLIELYPIAEQSLIDLSWREADAKTFVLIAFLLGMLLIAGLDRLVPIHENPHEMHRVEEISDNEAPSKLMRVGMLSAVAIAIHNFPEGIATFLSTYHEPELGLKLAAAIAIHNVPEGIAIAIPVYFATQSRQKAILFATLSGLAEPLGALFIAFFFMPYWQEAWLAYSFAAISGVMVFIAFDQLLPAAEKYGEHHRAVYGLILGMVLMGVSLILFVV